MDNQTSLLLNWTYSHQDKSMDEELRQTLLLTMELEETRMKAQDELKLRDEQITQLQQLLSLAIQERNEAQEKCQKVLFEKLLLQKQLQQQQRTPNSGVSTIEDDDPRRGIDLSSSDCEESIVSSPPHHHHLPPPPPELPVVMDRPLPEKGKFLQAVMKAGPLLQTLLLAGPLPQWRHPPPPLDPYQIPPPPLLIAPPPPPPLLHTHHPINQDPNNCGRINNRKRDLFERSDSSIDQSKHRKILLR
ncbi:hypothetical protein ABFS82_14G238700 [Erythranthe guttata]|uniref:Uncharacterized protein n=1 Tax=Erythranthe guttata TaxID=4155 RepID=A0A022R7A6_ERYGU|nr:PREDICTED: protein enabled homolog [Erythranthe guttata]EYU36131.1 hypothetical protein MIMGU_mgv1a022153mg [Erythranthe guttata]|eukprot:XP_012838328.1 PREDICTED: protein enabled homolog [Erythranthe guttata]